MYSFARAKKSCEKRLRFIFHNPLTARTTTAESIFGVARSRRTRPPRMTMLSSTGGLKRWTALPRSFPMAVEGIEDRTDRPERVERLLESRAEEEANRVPVEPEVRSPVPAEEFLRLGRQKQAEKYMDTQLVAFRFEGEIEPDPSHAPIASFHPMREVVNAMEEELYAFRPEMVFGFLREAFRRFPGRLPVQDHHDGPLNDDDYAARISNAIKKLVSEVALERPAEPFDWLDEWLETQADAEALDAARHEASLEERAAAMDVREMSELEFREFALELFKKFDADKNGLLDPWEMREVLSSAALDLTEAEQRDILAEIDANENGVVDYKEFVPFLHGLMAAVRSKNAARAARDERDRATRDEAQLSFVKGMTHDELDATLRRVFEDADLDGNGVLDPREFSKALRSADLGLSKKEINLLLAESDKNADGVVDYDEFVPVCFDILVERAKNKRLESDALASTDAVTKALLDAFREADTANCGKLKVRQLKHCLRTLTENDVLPLSKSQIVAVCSEAQPSPEDGLVAYARFAPTAANVVYGMLDFEAQKKRMAAINDLANVDTSFGVMRGMSPDTVEELLRDAFAACDLDGNGVLDEDEMRLVLDSVGVSELGLTEKQILGIVAAADADGDGGVDYEELSSLVHETVRQLAMEDAIRHRAFRNARANVVSRKDILHTRDDTLGAALASMSTDDVSHLKHDFDAGGRGAAGKIRNQRSVKIRLGGNFKDYV